jgi:hypothetical protein
MITVLLELFGQRRKKKIGSPYAKGPGPLI